MSSAAARQRLCRQHFTAANERIKLNPTDQATRSFEAPRWQRTGKNHARPESVSG
jgi:hypothetical protein